MQQNKKTKKVSRRISHDETCQKFKDMVTSNGYSVNKNGWITRTDFMLGLRFILFSGGLIGAQ